MKDLINEVRLEVGRDRAQSVDKTLTNYWIVTPPGSYANKNGDTKERHTHKVPLNDAQVKSLVATGFDIFEGKKFEFKDLKKLIPNIELLDTDK